jgi:hypothetical protein
VIDAGYRGEILVVMTNLGDAAVELKAGEKIAQMVPVPVLTGLVQEVETLEGSARAEKGFRQLGTLIKATVRVRGLKALHARSRRNRPSGGCVSLAIQDHATSVRPSNSRCNRLWANKMRTILTLIGVVMGVASVIMVITLVNGANKYVAPSSPAMAPTCSQVNADVERDLQRPRLLPLSEAQDSAHRGL